MNKRFVGYFQNMYLKSLVEAKNAKWQRTEEPARVGDLCLIAEPNQKRRNEWPMGIITEIKEGRDGFVRNCKLRTTKGEISRSIRSLVFLRHVGEEAQLSKEQDSEEGPHGQDGGVPEEGDDPPPPSQSSA